MCNSVHRRNNHIILCLRKLIFTGIAILVCLLLFGHDRGRQKEHLHSYRRHVRNVLQDSSLELLSGEGDEENFKTGVTLQPGHKEVKTVVPKVRERTRGTSQKRKDTLPATGKGDSEEKRDAAIQPLIRSPRTLVPTVREDFRGSNENARDPNAPDFLQKLKKILPKEGDSDDDNDLTLPLETENVTLVPPTLTHKIQQFKSRYVDNIHRHMDSVNEQPPTESPTHKIRQVKSKYFNNIHHLASISEESSTESSTHKDQQVKSKHLNKILHHAERVNEQIPTESTTHKVQQFKNRYLDKIHHALESSSEQSSTESSTHKIQRFKTKYLEEIHHHLENGSEQSSTASPVFRPTPNIENETEKFEEECTPPAYHEFPPDLFTNYQRAHGAIITHILVVLYMFYAVAIVCDDYFISSLEECCNRLGMSEDVAGATFMAAGSSAPELFTAILGVLVAKGDVGTGTIVGSAVFNVLFVIGICGIFAGRVVTLSWWPITRDSVFYSFTVVVLIIIIYDSKVTWYESVIMLIIYSFYIVLMKFNSRVHLFISRRVGIEDESTAAIGILSQSYDNKCYSSYVPFNNEIDECAQTTITSQTTLNNDETVKIVKKRLTFFEAAQMMLMTSYFPPLTRFRAAGRRVILENQARRRAKKLPPQVSIDGGGGIPRWRSKSISASVVMATEDDWKRIPTKDEGLAAIVKWIIRTPVLAVLYFTIPDCKKARWKNFFLLTFAMSILWTAIFSYVMVWMVTLAGYTLGIPDSIMGITFLAAGTSVPDAFASLIVARQGQGDMAVSNSIGSNVFDILVGLAVPWFIYTAMIEPGEVATINSRGMVYSVVLLFLTIIVTVGGVYLSQWQLTRRLGILLLCVYVVFLIISCMIEFNCFGYVNPPMCDE